MEPASESRFDPNYAVQLLLEIAHEKSLDNLLRKLVQRVAARPTVAACHIWLIERGDLCPTCPQRSECPEQSRCLHLVARKENSMISENGKGLRQSGAVPTRLPLGVGLMGRAIASGQQIFIGDLGKQPASMPIPAWMREEGIRAGAIEPIVYKGEALGAIVSMARVPLEEEARPWGRIFADHIGAAIVNARAFEEVRMAGKRLEEANQTLEEELAERKRTEEKLRQSEQRYRRIVNTASEGIWELDEHYVTTLVNQRMAEMLGYEPHEMENRPLDDFLFEDDLASMGTHIAARRQGLTERFEQRYRRKDASAVWMHVSATPILDGERRFLGSFAMLTDITERKHAEDALRQSETYLAEAQRLTHTGSWALDVATRRYVYVSEEIFRIFGFDPQAGFPTREDFLRLIVPEDRNKLEESFYKSLHEKVDTYVEYRIMRPDGTIRDIYTIRHPVLSDVGEIVQMVGTSVDITERKRTEEELRKHREHLEELVKQRTQELALLNQLVYGSLESGEVGAWWIDSNEPDTCHALDNTARMVGLEPDPTGKKAYKLSGWDKMLMGTAVAFPDYAPIIEESKERLAGVMSGKYENFRVVHPLALTNGTLKWMDSRAEVARRNERGQAQLITGTMIDVTKLKRAEAELAEAKARAEAANREKSRFLANMSHELRTPLNAVLGFSRLLKNGPDMTPHQQETLDIVVRSGEHLLHLINNVLDMAKIESGRIVIEESEVDLHQLLHEMQSLMGVGAVEKGLNFALELAPDLPRFLALDAGKLRQVLLNLAGNAIKYTHSGGVKLLAKRAGGAESDRAQLRFEVEDSGPGISQEDCQRIFLPFVQVGGQAPVQAGTGLGLAICKQYVELMGGQIGVASEPGKGSVFYFDIPVRVLASVTAPRQSDRGRILGLAEGQPCHRLLIVEDQPENRLLLRRLLDPLGFELREAANGQEAVALFDQWHPDLIWMDIRMPVMDGLEAVRRIRTTKAGASTKIIALTAHALEEEREPIMAAGCDDLVRKPFREQEIFDALARHLRLKFIYEKAPRQESTPQASELALSSEQLDALPAKLRQELRQAVLELDTARTHALIEQVTERDAALGRALNALATQLEYQQLLKLLDKEHSQTRNSL